MNDREFPKAIVNELLKEGFSGFNIISRNRFFARYDDILYEFRVKYCIKPRKLKFTDIGYMTALMSPDAIKVFISNGTDLTTHSIKHLQDHEITAILNWGVGMSILDKLDYVSVVNTQKARGVKMNGFEMLSATYKKAAESGDISIVQAEKDCRILDFLATCDDEDLFRLFDSSAFNEISKCYLRLAVKELVSEGTLDEDQAMAVRNRFSFLFSEKKAKEVCDMVS